MKARKIFIIISMILLVAMIGFGCRGIRTTELEERIEELEKELEEKDPEEGAAEEETGAAEEEEPEQGEETEEDGEAEDSGTGAEEESTGDGEAEGPAISLAIYQDATYSSADDVCYYRIEATVTGSPTPSVEWSRDDSRGAFGNRRAQVNLSRGQTYTLTATATNSAGSATDSITLTWGCDGEEVAEADGDSDGDEHDGVEGDSDGDDGGAGVSEGSLSKGATSGISGTRNSDGVTSYGPRVGAGDDETNKQVKGFISWDIRELHGVEVIDAEILFTSLRIINWPQGIGDNLVVKELSYGSTIDGSDYAVGGTFLANIPLSSSSYTISNSTLINKLQEALDSGRNYFQIKIGLDGTVLSDHLADQMYINNVGTEAGLYISYRD